MFDVLFSVEGHKRAVLPVQAVRGQVPLLLLCSQAQENVARSADGARGSQHGSRRRQMLRSSIFAIINLSLKSLSTRQ